jgi:peptidoglycan hydrolase-like protein with peptidoglycan-binding domain
VQVSSRPETISYCTPAAAGIDYFTRLLLRSVAMKCPCTVFAALFASTIVCHSQDEPLGDKPSFDCSKAHNAVGIILCSGPEAARIDWELNSALWALDFSTDEPRRPMLDRDQQMWRQSLDRLCALPHLPTAEEQAGQAIAHALGRMMLGPGINLPGPQPITQAHARCVLNAYRARAALLRSKLTGDALAEAQLSAEQHAALQYALEEKGFLRPYQTGGGTPDGEFGPFTRNAIREFQQSINATPTGCLSDDQRAALLEPPGERDRRAAEAVAAERAKRDALEAKRRAEEQAKQAEAEADHRARADLVKKLTEKRDRIQAQIAANPTRYPAIEAQVNETVPQLAAANEDNSLEELKLVDQRADDLLQILAQLQEFNRVSAIAQHQIEKISAELKTVVSDAPYVSELNDAINSVKMARQSGALQQIQRTLAALNQVYDRNRSNIRRDQFASP